MDQGESFFPPHTWLTKIGMALRVSTIRNMHSSQPGIRIDKAFSVRAKPGRLRFPH